MLQDLNVQFGKAVRRWRKKRGISQERLAELCDLHGTYLGRVERGTQNISLKNIGKIARALKVKLRDLFKDVR
jgi:transcriptional regulator with XRE-family HTH domain